MRNQITIHCGTPMVRTFMFSGAEFYCVKCGNTEGIFGGIDINETDELLKEWKENEKLFQKIADDYIPKGGMFLNCEQCKREEHLLHASQEDIKKSDEAYKLLAGGILEEESNATN